MVLARSGCLKEREEDGAAPKASFRRQGKAFAGAHRGRISRQDSASVAAYRPFPPPGSYAEVFLLLKNLTDQRIEGWLTLTPPAGWNIEPGTLLMIAIRPRGTISAEFYLSVPDAPAAGPHLLQIEVTADDQLIAAAAFDLRDGLLFLVGDNG